jgi:hypothetical protein
MMDEPRYFTKENVEIFTISLKEINEILYIFSGGKPNKIFIYIYEVKIKSVLSSLSFERYFYKI